MNLLKGQKNLTLAAYDSIKDMMFNYDIVPGQRLVFVDLAKQLGVSRTPVNNALSILAKEGYLDFVPNQGYSVHKLTKDEAESLYEIREIIEVGTIGKAIRQMTDEKLKIFENKKQMVVKSITDRVHRKIFILDTEFHASIIEMIENPYLTEKYREVCQKIFLRHRIEDLRMERMNEIVNEHEQLYKAISIKDVDWAKELIKTHHGNAKKNLFAIIFQKENGKTV
ncbi:GntR family transcriptional regulator [Desulfonema limicola]|uniref:GntR family transcriptional regulator n=1 Tax=Desulfonema limicola TaxID=45656 RepID=UPI001A9AED5D|nr:GntR family transcriptional regulator [Desulfonema limicola]